MCKTISGFLFLQLWPQLSFYHSLHRSFYLTWLMFGYLRRWSCGFVILRWPSPWRNFSFPKLYVYMCVSMLFLFLPTHLYLLYLLHLWSAGEVPVQFISVAQSCPTLCDPVNRSMPGLPVHHQLKEFTQTHAHQVGDAIQPAHPLSSPSPSAPNPSQHQGLFQWVNSLHEVAKVLEFQSQVLLIFPLLTSPDLSLDAILPMCSTCNWMLSCPFGPPAKLLRGMLWYRDSHSLTA